MQPIMTVNLGSVSCSPPIKVHVEVDKISIPMEVDTGASVSVKSENVYYRLWPRRGQIPLLSDCRITLESQLQ